MIKGACRYCGQIVIIENAIDAGSAEEKATMQCKCEGAKAYKRTVKRREKAKDNIELAIHEIDEEVCDYLKQCVELVDRRRIASITVDTGKGVKVSVKKTLKDTIKVTKKISKDVVYDE